MDKYDLELAIIRAIMNDTDKIELPNKEDEEDSENKK